MGAGRGRGNINNPEAQKQQTGQTPEQAIAALNTNPQKAHLPLEKFDAQALGKRVEAQRAIKDLITAEALKLSDEAYRKLFYAQALIIEVRLDPDTGRPEFNYLSAAEKQNLKPAEDGKIHIATNGIFNNDQSAAKYALQHSTIKGPQYLVYFPEANNMVSELMVAAYQKHLENDALGLSTATQEIKRLLNEHGEQGLHLQGHSRGSMTIGNALESQAKAEKAQGSLSKTTIEFFGPAYNAEKADGLLSQLQNREAMDTIEQKMQAVLKVQNHAADPVGRFVGGNSATGGSIPEGSTSFQEMIKAAMGKENTSHNCYGSADQKCKGYWKENSRNPSDSVLLKKFKTVK